MADMVPIPENRPLTTAEESLVRWLLEHGAPEAAGFLTQLRQARVVSLCPCGCASIDFAVGDRQPPPTASMQILADYVWQDAGGHRFGVFVFAKDGVLAGLDVFSVDGLSKASTLPRVEVLKPARAGWGA
jgi:hypothetical protein